MPALASKLAVTPGALCQWEMAGWHPPEPGRLHDKPFSKSTWALCYQSLLLPTQKLPSAFGAGSASGRLELPTCSSTDRHRERERVDIPQGANEGDLLQLRKIKLHCTMLLRLSSGEATTSCVCLGMKGVLFCGEKGRKCSIY